MNNAVGDPNNALAQLVASQPDDRKLIEELFLRFLARRPTAKEIELGIKSLSAPQRDQAIARQALLDFRGKRLAKMAEWEAELQRPAVWKTLVPAELESDVGATFTTNDEGVTLVAGKRAKDSYTLTAEIPVTSLTGLRLEALADPSPSRRRPRPS